MSVKEAYSSLITSELFLLAYKKPTYVNRVGFFYLRDWQESEMEKRGILKKTPILMLIIFLGMITTGTVYAQEVKIAIIDSGARGYVDYYKSFTAYSADNDLLNHGTRIARLIRNNSPHAKIHMLQVCQKIDGALKPSKGAILEAIQWSVDNQMDIVNMSLVTHVNEEIEKAIEDAATNHGILFVAAAGNKTFASEFIAGEDGFMRRRKEPLSLSFPASSPYVISVGALDSLGKIARYSVGSSDVYAQGRVHRQKGTSFACARITAQIANVLVEYNPPRQPSEILSYL